MEESQTNEDLIPIVKRNEAALATYNELFALSQRLKHEVPKVAEDFLDEQLSKEKAKKARVDRKNNEVWLKLYEKWEADTNSGKFNTLDDMLFFEKVRLVTDSPAEANHVMEWFYHNHAPIIESAGFRQAKVVDKNGIEHIDFVNDDGEAYMGVFEFDLYSWKAMEHVNKLRETKQKVSLVSRAVAGLLLSASIATGGLFAYNYATNSAIKSEQEKRTVAEQQVVTASNDKNYAIEAKQKADEGKAKADEDARLALEAKVKAEEAARLDREAKDRADAEKAKADEDARLALEAKVKAEEAARLDREAKEKTELIAKLDREAKTKAEENARLEREAKAKAETEKQKAEAAAKFALEEKVRLEEQTRLAAENLAKLQEEAHLVSQQLEQERLAHEKELELKKQQIENERKVRTEVEESLFDANAQLADYRAREEALVKNALEDIIEYDSIFEQDKAILEAFERLHAEELSKFTPTDWLLSDGKEAFEILKADVLRIKELYLEGSSWKGYGLLKETMAKIDKSHYGDLSRATGIGLLELFIDARSLPKHLSELKRNFTRLIAKYEMILPKYGTSFDRAIVESILLPSREPGDTDESYRRKAFDQVLAYHYFIADLQSELKSQKDDTFTALKTPLSVSATMDLRGQRVILIVDYQRSVTATNVSKELCDRLSDDADWSSANESRKAELLKLYFGK